MEVIKRKICLEDFKSRIPSKKLKCVATSDVASGENSWGNIPDKLYFNGNYFNYKFIMDLYYDVINLVVEGVFLTKGVGSNERFVNNEKEWRDYYFEHIHNEKKFKAEDFISYNILYISELKDFKSKQNEYNYLNINNEYYYWGNTKYELLENKPENIDESDIIEVKEITDKEVVDNNGNTYKYIKIKDDTGVYLYYQCVGEYLLMTSDTICVLRTDNFEKIKKTINSIIGDKNIFSFIQDVHEKIGKHVTPSYITGAITPLYFYDYDLDIKNNDGLLSRLLKLSNSFKNETNIINSKIFESYGGYNFLTYLEELSSNLNEEIVTHSNVPISGKTTIDIPLLITSKILDLGLYKSYNVYDENDNTIDDNEHPLNVVRIKGESKLSGLFSRREEVDDNGNVVMSYLDGTTEIYIHGKNGENGLKVTHIQQINTEGDKVYVIGDSIVSVSSTTSADNAKNEFNVIYVIGGKFEITDNTYTLMGDMPTFDVEQINNIYGIWYKDTYDKKKAVINSEEIDNKFVIDLNSKKVIYDTEGSDYPRYDYIESEIIYATNNDNGYTNNPIFYDEKMLGLSYPLKEKYDIAIDRGSAHAFEKHLQLGEIKSMQDLENYRNGYLFNK